MSISQTQSLTINLAITTQLDLTAPAQTVYEAALRGQNIPRRGSAKRQRMRYGGYLVSSGAAVSR